MFLLLFLAVLLWFVVYLGLKAFYERSSLHTLKRVRASYQAFFSYGAIGIYSSRLGPHLRSFLTLVIGSSAAQAIRQGPLPLHQSLTYRNRKTSLRIVLLNEFYSLGALVGIIGCFSGSILLVFWFLSYLLNFGSTRGTPSDSNDNIGVESGSVASMLVKRAVMESSEITTSPPATPHSSSLFTPLIPGVTIPWSHIPFLIVGVFVSSVIHELGHLMIATLESIPTESVGVFIFMGFVGAFVSLSSNGGHNQLLQWTSLKKLKVASAGVWHNLVLCLVIWLLYSDGANFAHWFAARTFYNDISQIGLAVQHVGSQIRLLVPSLSPGIVIKAVDDVELHDNAIDQWSSLLLAESQTPDAQLGWCIPRHKGYSTSCCNRVVSQNSIALSDEPLCFVNVEKGLDYDGYNKDDRQRCLTVDQVLKPKAERCLDHCANEINDECIRLNPNENATIISASFQATSVSSDQNQGSEGENWSDFTILYQGNRRQLFDQIKVGTLLPRLSILPISLPFNLYLLSKYTSIASTSLAFFNVLPIYKLDGEEILSSVLTPFVTDKQIPPHHRQQQHHRKFSWSSAPFEKILPVLLSSSSSSTSSTASVSSSFQQSSQKLISLKNGIVLFVSILMCIIMLLHVLLA